MKHQQSVRRFGALAALAAVSTFGNAQETEKSEGGLEEIVVTAQKRSEPLQQTPVSVTALTADTLANMQITTMEGLQHEVPNLYMEQALAGTTTPKMFLRGVGVDPRRTFFKLREVGRHGLLPELDVVVHRVHVVHVLAGHGVDGGAGAEQERGKAGKHQGPQDTFKQ